MKNEIREVYFESYGCTANKNSCEIMKGLVKQAGLNITTSESFSDLIVINSCAVKSPTEEKIRKRINVLLEKDKTVILAGCMPRLNKDKLLKKMNLYLLDVSHAKDIVNLISDIKNNHYEPEKYLKPRNEVKADLPKYNEEKFIGITQISEGCLGNCSYCIVKLAKGKLFSYPKEKIIENIKNDLANGCREIWLTSQDNASYGNEDGNYSLPELLKEIVAVPGKFKIRIGMMNPNNLIPILKEMIELYKDKKIFKFLHIPIQSGSDKVLTEMNRRYKKNDILKIISEFKKQIPDITIATDIITGYPTETEKDFQKTLDLIKEIKPEILNRSNFYPRKGTQAEKLKEIDSKIMNKRANRIMRLHLEICRENQQGWLGKKLDVLVDKKGFGTTYLARTDNYKLVAIQSLDKSILGKRINVRIKRAMEHYLIGEIEE